MPKRIQRKRTKGWKMPENAVSVTRRGKYGNPFRVGGYFRIGGGWLWLEALSSDYADDSFIYIKDAAMAAAWFRRMTDNWSPSKRDEVKRDLAGHDLACFCPLDQPCHADVLLEIANSTRVHASVKGE